MKKIYVKSSLNPALFRYNGMTRIVAGTIYEVNGKPWPHQYVAVEGMTLTLNDVVWVRPPAPKPVKPLTKQVKGSSGKIYTLTRQPNGKWMCTCPGYQYRRFCKHTGAK